MKLYTNPYSPNCRKIHGLLAHTGFEVEREMVDLRAGAQKQPAFLAINPNGKVPVLVDGDRRLWESNAIACRLAGEGDSALWPRSDQRYDIMRWLFWESNHWAQAIGRIVVEKIFHADNPDQKAIDRGLADFRVLAGILDGHLAKSDWLSGDAPTVAEFSLGVWLGYTGVCALPLGDFSNVSRWHDRLAALPAWREVTPPKG